MLLTVSEVEREIGFSRDFRWQETAVSLELLQGLLQEDIWLDAPVEVCLSIKNAGDRLLCNGEGTTRLKMCCSRCLAEFTADITFIIEEQFLFSRYAGQSARQNPEEDFEDIEVLEGDTIDASEVVIDALLGSLPMKPLCNPDCKGLCSVCGKDLNTGSCDCHTAEIDPRLAVLASWLESEDQK